MLEGDRRSFAKTMNALLVYPEWPDTYWSFRHALPFQGKRSASPPLGLLTIAVLLPTLWVKRLVDTNVRALTFRSGMGRRRARQRHAGAKGESTCHPGSVPSPRNMYGRGLLYRNCADTPQ